MLTNLCSAFSLEVTILVSAFALLWFLAGIAVGTRLGNGQGTSVSNDRPRRRSERIEIYVGNLPYDVTEKEFNKAFAQYGRVLSARIIKHRMSGKSKGFGFIEMDDPDEVTTAVRAMNGADFRGRKLVVNEAKSRSNDR